MESRKMSDDKIKYEDDKLLRSSVLAPERLVIASTGSDTQDAKASGGAPLKKQELIAQVVERSKVPRKHAKPVIEAMLAVLGDALSEGRDLNLEPMGKIKRKRVKETATARIVITNIRQSKTESGDDSSTSASARLSASGIVASKEAVAEGGEGR